jgi:hypothetical protein
MIREALCASRRSDYIRSTDLPRLRSGAAFAAHLEKIMTESVTLDTFRASIQRITDHVRGKSLDAALAADLNATFAPASDAYRQIFDGCRAAIAAGWMCNREAGGIKFGRVLKPSAELGGFSVDVVDMNDVRGPHHRHPNGEIDLVMPLVDGAKFDGHGAGWVVYGAGSAHFPTVTEGRALVLYLLPEGAIEFTKSAT